MMRTFTVVFEAGILRSGGACAILMNLLKWDVLDNSEVNTKIYLGIQVIDLEDETRARKIVRKVTCYLDE
jgi:hypothetical protein